MDKQGKSKKKGNKKLVNFWINHELYNKIKNESKEKGITVTEFIRRRLEAHYGEV